MPKLQRILFPRNFEPERDTGTLNAILEEIYNRLENTQDLHPFTARVARTSSQGITNNTVTAVIWQAVDWDTDEHWESSANTRLTIQSQGLYFILCALTWDSNSTGERLAFIRKNGATTIGEMNQQPVGNHRYTMIVVDNAQIGDFYEVVVRQQSGVTPLNLITNGEVPWFALVKIGEL